MTLLLRSSRRFFYRHPAQLALALIGIAAGVAVVTGVALLRGQLLDSLDAASRALSGDRSLRIEARAGGELEDGDYVELRLRRGSPALQPFLSATVSAGDARLELIATDPLSASAESGASPALGAGLMARPDAALINAATAERLGVTPGQTLSLRHEGRQIEVEILERLDGQAWLDNRLLMDIAGAQDLLERPGQLSWIAAPAEAEAWLKANLPEDLRLIEPETRRAGLDRLTRGMRINLTALSLLALLVGLFVVHSVLSFLLVQRQRQIAMLRAIGVTRGRLTAWLLLEALALSFLGCLIGLGLGTELARALLGLVQSPAAELYGLVTGQQILPSRTLYLGILALTLGMTTISVSGLLRTAFRIQPGQAPAFQQRAADPGPGLAGLAIAVTALVMAGLLAIWISDSLIAALIALFLWLCACALLAPRLGLAVLGRLPRLLPDAAPARALGMLAGSRRRLSPSLAALSLALGLSAGMALMVGGFRTAVDDWVTRLLRADAYLSIDGRELDQAQIDSIGQWPEIAALSSVRQTRRQDGSRLMAYDLPEQARTGFEFLQGGSPEDWAAFEAGSAVFISEPFARRQALVRSDTISLEGPDGLRPYSILGIYRDYASDAGQIAIQGAHYRVRFSDPARDSVGLYLSPGQSLPLLETMAMRLGEPTERLRLTLRDSVRRITLAVFDRTFRITQALAVLVGTIAVVCLVSALLALGLERRREYATLRALGLTQSGLGAWILTQTLGLALVAALLAIPISLLIHGVLSGLVQPRAFGWSVPLSLSLGPWLQLLPLAAAAGLLGGLLPAWSIARRPPAGQLRAR